MPVADAELLTHVGPGTPTGELMREYWIPALMSSELERDGDPLRLMLLGERLVAFRDTSGRVGVMDHRCPHRCTSLFLGRNEDDGLRCAFHGWKFDVEGRCVDMPNVVPAQEYMDRLPSTAYRVVERNGLVWVYMGRRADPPPLPSAEVFLVPEEETRVFCMQREANWLQVLEGDLDTAHFGFLHLGSVDASELSEDNALFPQCAVRSIEAQAADRPWGTTYGASRPIGDQVYWRYANYLLPFYAQNPQGSFDDHVDIAVAVPMDDTHTMFIRLIWTGQPISVDPVKRNGDPIPFMELDLGLLPNTTDWFGRWRPDANPANDWHLDRGAQRGGLSFTGIPNFFVQDQAAAESGGPIVDHTREHLGPTDVMVARSRRRLLQAVAAHRDRGEVPASLDDPACALGARAGAFMTEPGAHWEEAYDRRLQSARRPGLPAKAPAGGA